MKNIGFFSVSGFVTIVGLLFACHVVSQSDLQFQCANRKGNIPELPKSYSANIRMNFINKEYTVEMKYAKNNKEKKELFEMKKKNKDDTKLRHVKYIKRGDEGSTVFIEYQENKQPKCEVIKSTYIKDFLKKEDSGETDNVILKALEVMTAPSEYNIYFIGPAVDTGVFATRYEGCLTEPKINISITIAAEKWNMPSTSSEGINYPETVTVQIGETRMKAFYSNFDVSQLDNTLFDIPADVYCKGFRIKKMPPSMPNYFSYSAELINYNPVKNGIIPMLSQRKVYYDYNDRISRIDFNDLLASDSGSFTETTAQKKSIIHDFNSGVQYIIDTFTGKCSVDTFQETFSAISFEKTKDNKMFTGAQFFWLDDAFTSYNGQFPLRGIMADVYTALRIDPNTGKSYIISWYFSTESAEVAENENVEKNVLLSMYIRPETAIGKENVTEIHFFDFAKEEQDVFNFDLTKCFNETTSKTLVFTFPAHEDLRGSEKLIGRLLNIAIKDVTGVRKYRIYTKEVIFSGKYMYAEFSLLEDSPSGPTDEKISLEDALEKLQNSVSKGNFSVKVPTEDATIVLKPEPNGLNVFAGDRPRIAPYEGYHEGSVIALTIGMLLLGFLLGTITINLIISRKHGVSLFQKSRFSKGFDNPLNESSI